MCASVRAYVCVIVTCLTALRKKPYPQGFSVSSDGVTAFYTHTHTHAPSLTRKLTHLHTLSHTGTQTHAELIKQSEKETSIITCMHSFSNGPTFIPSAPSRRL